MLLLLLLLWQCSPVAEAGLPTGLAERQEAHRKSQEFLLHSVAQSSKREDVISFRAFLTEPVMIPGLSLRLD